MMKYGGYIGVAAVLAIMLAIPQLQYLKNKKHYFTITEDYEAYANDMLEKENAIA